MITLKDVSFSYESEAETKTINSLENINLTINDGECVVLCGRSGCGKTSITRLINGLIPSYYNGILSGTVKINYQLVNEMELYEIATMVGSVFQNPKSQFFNADVESELSFVCENLGFDKETIDTRVRASVTAFSIDTLFDKNVSELSGGEKQKIACACVSTPNPDIFVFDEPSANLDNTGMDLLKDTLAKLKEQSKTIVIAEHRLHYLNDIADRYIYLQDGRIVNIYSKSEFMVLTVAKRNELGLRSINPMKIVMKKSLEIDECSEKIIFKDFHFRFHKKENLILDIEELTLPKGSITTMVGLNGAGKSTFANCICGIYKKCGKILIGEKVHDYKKRLSSCYMVMQDSNHQLFTESVLEEVLLSMQKEDVKKAEKILESLNLSDLKERHPISLSGGQKQRLAIATALASDRELLVFDEPTSGLDYKNMMAVSSILKNLKDITSCLIIITHDMELVEQCADHIVELENGRVKNCFVKIKQTQAVTTRCEVQNGNR